MADDTGGKLSNAQNGMHPPLKKKKKKSILDNTKPADNWNKNGCACLNSSLKQVYSWKKKKVWIFIFPCSDDCLYLIPHFVSGDSNSIILTLEKKRKKTQKYDKQQAK